MGREVRRVPKDWQHPKNEAGNLDPLKDNFIKELYQWDEGSRRWDQGQRWDYFKKDWGPKDEIDVTCTYAEYAGDRPERADYMPDWPEAERTHWQMYEDTSEGTPISPVMETPEALARWLADNNASAFAGMTATYSQWLVTVKKGWALCSMQRSGEPLMSGVEANERIGAKA